MCSTWEKKQRRRLYFAKEVKNIAKSRREVITPKPMEVDRIQTDWNWDDDAKEMTDNHEQEHETDENQINYVGKGKGKG